MKSRILAIIALAAVGTGLVALKPLIAQAKGDQTFSHAFRQASADQVLAWMEKQGIEVQVDRSELPSGRLTFAFQGLDRDSLVESFGQMVGMSAEKRGNVYSLMRGVGGDGPAEHLGGEEQPTCVEPFVWDQEKELPKIQEFHFAPMDEMFEFSFMEQDPKAMVEEVLKAIEESGVKMNDEQKAKVRAKLAEKFAKMHAAPFMAMPGMEGHKFFMGPEGMKFFGPEQEKAMEEMRKHMEEMRKSGKLPEGSFYYHFVPEQHKMRMEELEKHLQKMHGEGGVYKLREEELAKIKSLQSEEHKKAMEELHRHMQELEKSGELRKLQSEDFKKHLEQMQKELGENMKVLQIKLENVKKFISSLSPAQRELAKKQGHLKPSDLTKEQRELLGIGTDESVNITFQVDGEKISIKGGKSPAKEGVITV